MRQDTSAYVSIRHVLAEAPHFVVHVSVCQQLAKQVSSLSTFSRRSRISSDTSAYVSIRQHTSAYVAPSRGGGAFRLPGVFFDIHVQLSLEGASFGELALPCTNLYLVLRHAIAQSLFSSLIRSFSLFSPPPSSAPSASVFALLY
jgi:hypothetical protein